MNLKPTIGIEVHVELNTLSKVFSNSKNEFNDLPNTNVNVIDLGYPGTLPILNKEVINSALKIALALNCKINKKMFFDRKNYFYIDNPKNYQITQFKTPIGYDGYIEINVNDEIKKIEIEELHIEEDTCKSIHKDNKALLNYNRAGIPLVEIVTKPIIKSGLEASIYIETLRDLLKYLNVSDVKIEEGSMRCDANVSLNEENSVELGNKVEVKNIGSITNVNVAIDYEIKRQKELIENKKTIIKETRKFDDKKNITISMREKEIGNDYRYFPEPDIPVIDITDEWINKIRNDLPILPNELKNKFIKQGLNKLAINCLIKNKDICDFYLKLNNISNINAANLLTGDVISYLNKNNKKISDTNLNTNNFIELLKEIEKNTISLKMAKEIIIILLEKGGKVADILNDSNLEQISDENILKEIIKKILNNNKQSIIDYKEGKDRAVKFLMGQIMKETKGMANPKTANEILINELSKY